jgi:putative membrane protein
MTNYLIRLLVCGFVVMILPRYLDDVNVDHFTTAILVAFVMSVLNNFVKPVLKLISLPITFLTLGLFSLFISVVMVYLCDYLVPGFKVNGFLHPLIFSFVLSIVNSLVGSFQSNK